MFYAKYAYFHKFVDPFNCVLWSKLIYSSSYMFLNRSSTCNNMRCVGKLCGHLNCCLNTQTLHIQGLCHTNRYTRILVTAVLTKFKYICFAFCRSIFVRLLLHIQCIRIYFVCVFLNILTYNAFRMAALLHYFGSSFLYIYHIVKSVNTSRVE